MLEFLGFGKTKGDASDTVISTRTLSAVAPSAAQRDLVRVALHTLLKRHGIPPSWLAAELLPIASPQEPDAWIIQVAVLQWHTGFGQYLVALQKELLDSLKRIEQGPHQTHYSVHWVYAPDCACPYTALPSAAFWGASAADLATEEPEALAEKPAKAGKSKAAKPGKPTTTDEEDDGFAPTQMRED
ncbi:MAG: hypothetical protein CFE44_13575 [Burkholderiales bacterium PBB4]|nr:MAG: hypothetical protein CFE44_13575 [Burkholderiales bacterium PBB4]